ncbi:MAG TPA: chaperone modulator CbpM [Afifellaceae bacterium]|nr:chaperone modulator CbpM [Afifellaceae bacterium]
MSFSERQVVETVEEISVRRLRTWVRRGWVRPERRGREHAFSELDVARIRLVCQLKDELSIDEEAIPVVLSLLDQLYGVRRELRNLARAVDEQPEQVRRRIAETFRRLSGTSE